MDIAKSFLRPFYCVQFLVIAVLTAIALLVHAESVQSQSLTSEQMQKLQKLQKEMQEIGQQLNEIRQATLEAKPELQKQQDDYRSMLLDTMQEQGNNPEPLMKRMNEIQGQLKDQEIDKTKRQQLIKKYQEKDSRLRQARQQAMQDQKVRDAAQSLSQATVEAMREQDPKTEELLKEMRQLRQKMQQLVADARAKSGADDK